MSMITGGQIRAARATLRWSVQELAHNAGVSTQTIKRFEVVEGIPPSRTQTLLDVKSALEAGGIEFIGTPEDGPGIRLRTSRRTE
jgi:DNA-binding transcriptional regulator YiaG